MASQGIKWPPGTPRTRAQNRKSAAFSQGGKSVSLDMAASRLQKQLDLLKAENEDLSTALPRNLNGSFKAGARADDPGAVVYFVLDGESYALACDHWLRVADNIVALAKHIDALRGMERWGVGSIKQAFAGYRSLPAPEHWTSILSLSGDAAPGEITEAYRHKAKEAHDPTDGAGSEARLKRLNLARDDAMRAIEALS